MARISSAYARPLVAGLLLAAAGVALPAQDTRTVTEPVVPKACTTLTATLVPVGDSTLAEADERRDDTQRIQAAIDGCAKGQAVVLRAEGEKRAFLTGPITLRPGVTLVVGERAVLFASRDPRAYDVSPGSCGVVNDDGKGCKAIITGNRATGSGVMGPGTIDGRGWATLLGQQVSWWDLAQEAKVKGNSQNCPRMMQLTRSDDFTLYRIRLRNSPNFHVVFDRGTGFTAWGVIVDTPNPRARNTDGIDPISSTNVTITRSFINTGDDNIAIKAGNQGPTSNITITHNKFYRGHGVSVGSETNGGVRNVLVVDLSVAGADNGLRIKSNASRGGLVENVEFRDVCIRDTKDPIEMDTHYTASPERTGTLIPEYRDIRLKDVHIIGTGRVTLDGYDAARPLRMSWDNVTFESPAKIKVVARHAELAVGPRGTNLAIAGENVKLTGAAAPGTPNACTGKFVPIPTTP